jgi:hypothetical protein
MVDKAEQISQKVEHELRQLIGDLHMQIIVLRAALSTHQEQAKLASPPEETPKKKEPDKKQPPPNPNGREHTGLYK